MRGKPPKNPMPNESDQQSQIRLQNSRDISVMFAKYAIQKGMLEGVTIRWNGADRPHVRRDKHELAFIAGKREVTKELSDTALVNLQAKVCFEVVWRIIREAVEEL